MIPKYIVTLLFLLAMSSLQYITRYEYFGDEYDATKVSKNAENFKDPRFWVVFVACLTFYCLFKLRSYKFILRWLRRRLRRQRGKKIAIVAAIFLMSFLASVVTWHFYGNNMMTHWNYTRNEAAAGAAAAASPSTTSTSVAAETTALIKHSKCSEKDHFLYGVEDNSEDPIDGMSADLVLNEGSNTDTDYFQWHVVNNPQIIPVPDRSANPVSYLGHIREKFEEHFMMLHVWLGSTTVLVFLKVLRFAIMLYSLFVALILAILMTYYYINGIMQYDPDLTGTSQA